MLIDVKVAAAGGRRRRVGFYSAIRREVPIRTFNDWANPPPGFCEIEMVAHGGRVSPVRSSRRSRWLQMRLQVARAWFRVDIGVVDFDEVCPVVLRCEAQKAFVVDVPMRPLANYIESDAIILL
jgi:hypothetical protein